MTKDPTSRRWTPSEGYGPEPKDSRARTLLVAAGALALFAAVVLGIVAAVAVPSYLRGRAVASEAAAVNTLRTFASAEETFRSLTGRYGSIPQLVEANLVDPRWGESRERDVYRFSVEVTGGGEGFVARADPMPDARGRRHLFLSSADLVVRYDEERPAGPTSPELVAE